MKRLPTFALTLIIVSAIAFQKSNPYLAFHVLDAQTSQPDLTESIQPYGDQPRAEDYEGYEDFRFQVVDAKTSKPIKGIAVHVLCMGGTPFAYSHDTTDDQGYARITSYRNDSGVAIISVRRSNEASQVRTVLRSNLVVRL